MEYHEVQLESAMELGRAISYLESIVAGLKSGRLCVQHEADEITLAPQRSVQVKIKARRKKDRESVALKVGWHLAVADGQDGPPLRISSAPAESID